MAEGVDCVRPSCIHPAVENCDCRYPSGTFKSVVDLNRVVTEIILRFAKQQNENMDLSKLLDMYRTFMANTGGRLYSPEYNPSFKHPREIFAWRVSCDGLGISAAMLYGTTEVTRFVIDISNDEFIKTNLLGYLETTEVVCGKDGTNEQLLVGVDEWRQAISHIDSTQLTSAMKFGTVFNLQLEPVYAAEVVEEVSEETLLRQWFEAGAKRIVACCFNARSYSDLHYSYDSYIGGRVTALTDSGVPDNAAARITNALFYAVRPPLGHFKISVDTSNLRYSFQLTREDLTLKQSDLIVPR